MSNPFEKPTPGYHIDFPGSDSLLQEQGTDFKEKLKATVVGGYAKGSVERYITELENTTSQMRHSLTIQLKELVLEKETLSQEHKLLQNQSKKAEDRVNELQQEINKITEETETFAKTMDQKVTDASNELKKAKAEAADFKNALQEMQVLLEKKEEEVKKLKEESCQLEETLRNTRLEFEDRLQDEKSTQAQLLSEIDQLKEQIDTHKVTFDSLEGSESKGDHRYLETLVQAQEEDRKQWIENIRNLEKEKKILESTIEHLRNENNDLYQENEAYLQVTEKLDLLHGQYKEIQEKNDLLEMDRQVSEEYIARYQLQEREHLILKKNSKNYRIKIQELEKEIFDMLHEMESQSKTVQALMEKSEQDQLRIRSLIQEKTTLQSNNVDYLEELRSVQKRLFELEALERERQEEKQEKQDMLCLEVERSRMTQRKTPEKKDLFHEKQSGSEFFSKKASS